MRCFFINLNRATQRREALEKSFAAEAPPTWTLQRVTALDAEAIEATKIEGALRPAEKACYLSHVKLIEANLGADEPIFILEDDAVFGKKTCHYVDLALKNEAQKLDWDLIYTDVGITSVGAMADLVQMKRRLAARERVVIISLKTLPFAGYIAAAAYIVNAKSLSKLHRLLGESPAINIPYDLMLRKLVHQGRLNAYVLFPFLTSVSDYADASSIQPMGTARTDLVWNLFRQFVWLEGDFSRHKAALGAISHGLSDESWAYAALWANLIDPSFKSK
jgi:GR25 family glycosyltransferase involved in LPS biosynthesis